eukprot:s9848_g3.t1
MCLFVRHSAGTMGGSGSESFIPIAVLSVAYRVGASLLARDMRPWADGWLGHRMLGGVHKNIAKFFDSIHGKHLQQVLTFLRAPEPFISFVQGVLAEQWRVFSVGGRVGQRCSLNELTIAKELSDTVDAAFQFSCDRPAARRASVAQQSGWRHPQASKAAGTPSRSQLESRTIA